MTAVESRPAGRSSGGPTLQGHLPTRAAKWARRAPLMPALVFMIIVTQLPFVVTLILSFISWNAFYIEDRHFAWFENYKDVLSDGDLRKAVWTTILLTVTVVLVSVILGLAIALLLNRAFFGRGIVRTLMIAPFLIVPVAAALVWKDALYNPNYGLLNGSLTWIWSLFGSSHPPQPVWLTNSPLLSVEISLIWQWTPFMMLILLAGLQSEPSDPIEAARVDGASNFQIFKFLTFPHMRRYLELAVLLGAIYVVQNFDAVFTITSGGLGTANLPYEIYQTFYSGHDYGQASAIGVLAVIASIIIATFALRVVSSLFKEENA